MNIFGHSLTYWISTAVAGIAVGIAIQLLFKVL
jgi:hypothetical protein